jgi:drug/metabolite transporter (DMT)-like permease
MKTGRRTGGPVNGTKDTPAWILHLFLLLFAFFGALGHPLGRILVGQGSLGPGPLAQGPTGHLHPFQLGSISLAIGFVCVCAFLAAAGKAGAFFRVAPSTMLLSFGLGIPGFFLFYICSFSALARIPASMNAVFISTTVVFTALFAAPFLGERIGPWRTAGIGIALCGAALVALGGGSVRGVESQTGTAIVGGIAFSLAGAIVNALYSVFGKKLIGENDPLIVSSLSMLSGALFLSLLAAVTSGYGSVISLGLKAWLLVILLGATLFGVSYPLFFYALKRMPATQASMYMYLIPVFAGIQSFALLRERFGWSFYAGFAVVMAGIALSGSWKKQRGARPRAAP